ncbi:MAG: hypothetical protein BWK80_11060 [Desulfobacteraceae bacterium IS3]|nr:MAG: hypothetical protein BWK80_11060 [Desulfobacteraceae bacterium IS3]
MKPIYFPFTYISEQTAAALAACFRQTAIYQPSELKLPETIRKYSENGILDIRRPVSGNDDRLNAIIKEYRRWAEFHQGTGKAFFNIQGNKIPFFDDTKPSSIRADILRSAKPENGSSEAEAADLLLAARIFLCIAQDFDTQHHELNTDLVSFEKMEQNLMKNLRGEDFDEIGIKNDAFRFLREDAGIYMTAERIKAWTRLMLHDSESSGLFITDSRAVFEHIGESAADAEKVFYFKEIATDDAGGTRENLEQYLDMLVKNPDSVSADSLPKLPAGEREGRSLSLKLCLVPGESPDEFFGRYIQQTVFYENKKILFPNTVFGLIEF